MSNAQTICRFQGIHESFLNDVLNNQPIDNPENRLCRKDIYVIFGCDIYDVCINQYSYQSAFFDEINLILARNFLTYGDGECYQEFSSQNQINLVKERGLVRILI